MAFLKGNMCIISQGSVAIESGAKPDHYICYQNYQLKVMEENKIKENNCIANFKIETKGMQI